jgi:guanosine-3',5'-bis(diphosphate) 3'-pyrophosphohydrolase
VVLAAALLHDTIEDTQTDARRDRDRVRPRDREHRGECSDDKSLTKLERKQAQIDHAAGISHKAKLVKLADKDRKRQRHQRRTTGRLVRSERKREYYDWAKQVVDRMRGTHAVLEARFDAEYAKRP